jgi:putative Ca2+/H+ antiporter (TMEM165/GDT1 family)
VDLHIALVCFPVIFLGELPDKTMFANLIMATRGRPVQVWLGAAAAFTVHVAIAVSVGVALFTVLPRRYVAVVVAALFLLGAAYAWREGIRPQQQEAEEREAAAEARPGSSRRRVGLTAFAVIFLAEWGDLTQILTANLAARYHSAWPVAAGSLLALWAVAALAVASGQTLLRFLSVQVIRKITAVVLVGLAAYTAWSALQ